MALHSPLTGSIHRIHQFVYADATAREAVTSLNSGDIGKVARQTDDGSYWILHSASPLEWKPFAALVRCNFDVGAGKTTVASPYGLGIELPDNAYIVRAFYDVVTTFESATDAATIALGVNTDDAAGLVISVAISAASDWNTGAHDCIPDGAAANFTTQTTGKREIELVLAVEDLTAGELNLYLEYIVSD